MSKVLLTTKNEYIEDTEKEAELLVEEYKNGKSLVVDTNIKRVIKKSDEYFKVKIITQNETEKGARSQG